MTEPLYLPGDANDRNELTQGGTGVEGRSSSAQAKSSQARPCQVKPSQVGKLFSWVRLCRTVAPCLRRAAWTDAGRSRVLLPPEWAEYICLERVCRLWTHLPAWPIVPYHVTGGRAPTYRLGNVPVHHKWGGAGLQSQPASSLHRLDGPETN